MQPLAGSQHPLRCTQWAGNGAERGESLSWTRGLFCANFCHSIRVGPPCQKTWCAKCYSSKEAPKFFIAAAKPSEAGDEDRLDTGSRNQGRDPQAFERARVGDDLMTQFECDVCVFRKLYHGEPNPHSEPKKLAEVCSRRVATGCVLKQGFLHGNTERVQAQRGPKAVPETRPEWSLC